MMAIAARAFGEAAKLNLWPLWLLLGLVGGLLIAPGGGLDLIYGAYDAAHPVIEAEAVIVERAPDSVVVAIKGTRHRACEYLTSSAYSIVGGYQRDANLERLDRPQTHRTRPLGPFDAGRWRVWPISGATAAEIHMTYNCDGRVLVIRAARVELEPAAVRPTS